MYRYKSIKKGAFLQFIYPVISLGSLQAVASTPEHLFDMPLDSLAQTIVSASKQEEKLFDAPLAANVISGEQILASGATSIPEALRLVPGLIVREQTNGNYDVHIRGLGNIPAGSEIVRTATNNLTLVMIDNRIVYNHNTGGTFWEMLPVDVHDIDRIEVVKGAASALYGPNAVTGVIHILTKNPGKHKESSLHVQAGNQGTNIVNYEGALPVEGFDARLSANFQRRNRHQDSYIGVRDGVSYDDPADIVGLFPVAPLENPDLKFPDKSNALEKDAVNLFINAEIISGVQTEFDIGFQQSEVQRVYDDNAATALTTAETDSTYLRLNNEFGVYKIQLTYEDGNYEVPGSFANNGANRFFDFDYENLDLSIDAKYDIWDLTIEPLLQFRDQEYQGDAFDGMADMNITSLGLRIDKKYEDLRLIGGIRGDYYDYSSDTETSYLFTATYTPLKNVLFRGSIGRAQQEPFMRYLFENLTFNDAAGPGLDVVSFGNEDFDVVEVDNIELGVRWQIDERWSLDLELFQLESENYQNNILISELGTFPVVFEYQNVADEAEQQGITFQVSYDQSDYSASFFLTGQETDIDNNIFSDENLNTPDYYGGFIVNYSGIDRVNLNISGYYFDESTSINCRHLDLDFNTPGSLNPLCEPTDPFHPQAEVESKLLINTKLTYQVDKSLNVFFNVRNAFNETDREFALSDETGAIYLLGFDWRVK